MGLPLRSLTAEANSCFMVRLPHGPNRIQGCGASIAPECGLPSDQLYQTSNNEGQRVAVTLDTKVLIQGCVIFTQPGPIPDSCDAAKAYGSRFRQIVMRLNQRVAVQAIASAAFH